MPARPGTIKDKLEPDIHGGALKSVAFWTKRTTVRELAAAFALTALLTSLAQLLTSLVPRLRPSRSWALGAIIVPALAAGALASASGRRRIGALWSRATRRSIPAVTRQKGEAEIEGLSGQLTGI